MNKNLNNNSEEKIENKEQYKQQYFKRINAVYKIQRIYLIFTSIFVSTIIVFGIVAFYQTKSIYSVMLTLIGIIYVTRNIINFRKLKKPDIARIDMEVENELIKSNESKDELQNNK